MMYPLLDGGLDQRARVRRIIAIKGERIADRIRHNDRGSEMDDGVDPVLCYQFGDARLISSVADQERCPRCHRPIEAGREIVEHHHPLASVDERVNHVAADITGTASDQDRHAVGPPNPTLGSLNLSCRTGYNIYSYNSFRQLNRRC